MIKICTSIDQSNKLLSLGLDPNTADMCWCKDADGCDYIYSRTTAPSEERVAWSLGALLELIPPHLFELERGIDLNIYRNINNKSWNVSYMPNDIINMQKDKFKQITNGDSPLDAAFEMICWLIEQRYIKVK